MTGDAVDFFFAPAGNPATPDAGAPGKQAQGLAKNPGGPATGSRLGVWQGQGRTARASR